MSEEKKAVDEAIRLEEIQAAMKEAWENTCFEPHYCRGSVLPTWCMTCGWDAYPVYLNIEQVIDENS